MQLRIERPMEHAISLNPVSYGEGEGGDAGKEGKEVSLEKQGWLNMIPRGGNPFSKTKRRWFVLRESDGTLSYYDGPNSSEPLARRLLNRRTRAH